MITKKVNRYYCEFCKKSGCNASVIKRHESSCTMNPDRVCNVCDTFLKQEQPDISKLIEKLPDAQMSYIGEEEDGVTLTSEQINDALALLREATGNCPACMLAALRQKGYAYLFYGEFDFKAELTKLREEHNKSLPVDW
jgi:hypothetical protein